MRRGHGSTKVPGVKLRPAAPTKYNKPGESSRQINHYQSSIADDVDSTDILKSCKKPFVGVVVCASGLTDKINLFQQAVQLGAQTSSDLTDRVTHLICEKSGSAKYNYCVEHGIPILQPSWITDAYDKWLSGETVDVAKSATIHRFPTFEGVRLCLTGISDVDRRKQIRRQLEKNGGVFIEALDKDTELTHLLCGPDRGESAEQKGLTSKMQFVIKANKARAQKVHLVWEDWFWDCMEFKGTLGEKEYLATGSRPPRKLRREPSPLLAPIASSAEQVKRRSSAISPLDSNADAEETAAIKRMPEAAAVLWENALRKRGFELRDGKLLRSPSKSRISSFLPVDDSQPSTPSSVQLLEDSTSLSRTKSSLSAAFKRTKSFAAKSTEPEGTKSTFQRMRSMPASAFKQSASTANSNSALAKESNQVPEGERNLFVRLRFRTLGEASGPRLTEALELRGGTVITDTDDDVDFIIVRLVGGSTFYHNELSEKEREKFRTECWIEQCMFEERVCAGDEHPAFVPLRLSAPIPGADSLVVHISGLNPSEKTPSVRLLKALGATVTDQLSRRNTHLICPCGSGPKFDKAQEWKIPILHLHWLFDTAKSGLIQDAAKYLVVGSSPGIPTTCSSETTGMMTDITNSEFVEGSSKKNKSSRKDSDKSQSSTSSSISAATSHVEIEPMFSESWIADGLLSDTVPEHPPTSSPPGKSCHSPDTARTTPSPIRRYATVPAGENGPSRKPSISPFISPTKSKVAERVPSSATPSPLRMPSMPSRNSRSTPSEQISPSVTTAPALTSTSTLSEESANVLKDAIASLLGKRPSSDDAPSSAPGKTTGATAEGDGRNQSTGRQPLARATKRSKPPPRTKSRQGKGLARDGSSIPDSARSFSRSTSLEVLGMAKNNALTATSSYTFDFTANSLPTESLSLSLFDSIKPITEAAEESMRVTYEDPSQRAEERRLLNLISGKGGGDVDVDADAMKVDGVEGASTAVHEESGDGKAHTKPKRKGRNLVRRVTRNGPAQS